MELERSSIAVYASNIGLSFVGFLATAYFAQTLGAAALGIFFTFDALTSVLEVSTRFGVDTGIEKRMSEADKSERGAYLTAGLAITCIPLIVVSGIILLGNSYVNNYVGIPVAVLLVPLLAASTSRWLGSAALRAEQKVARNAGIEFIGEVARVLFSVLLITYGLGIFALIYGLFIGIGTKIVLVYISISSKIVSPTMATIRDLWDFSKYTLLTSVSSLAYNWTDTLVLAWFAAKSSVGIYESAWKVSVVAVMASKALGTTVFPSISNWNSRGEQQKIETAITEAITYGLLLVIPAIVGAAILGEPFMRLIYHYDSGEIVLVLLMVEKLFQSPRIIVERSLTGIGKPDLVFKVAAVTLVSNLILNVILIPSFGMFGAAAATIATVLIALVLLSWYLRQFLKVNVDWRALIWQFGSSVLMGALVVGASRIVRPHSIPALLVLVIIGVTTYFIAIMLNERMRSRILDIL